MARRIILKQSTSSGTLPDGFVELGFDGTALKQKIGATQSDIGSGGGGVSITDANKNILIPGFSLNNTTTGSYNISLGYKSLQYNTTGCANVAQGRKALYHNTSGSNNISLGLHSLCSNTDGNNNISLGRLTLEIGRAHV